MAAVFLALALSPFASQLPDGLERVAEDKGFSGKEAETPISSPISGYVWPGLKSEKLAKSAAGATGTLFVFAVAYGLARIIRRKNTNL